MSSPHGLPPLWAVTVQGRVLASTRPPLIAAAFQRLAAMLAPDAPRPSVRRPPLRIVNAATGEVLFTSHPTP